MDGSPPALPRTLWPRLLAGAAFGLIVFVVAFVVVSERSSQDRVIKLADGRTIHLLGTSVGNSIFTTERPWHRLVKKYMPRRFSRWLPESVSSSCGYSTNCVTVYVSLVRTNENAADTGPPWSRYYAEDDAGVNYGFQGGACSSHGQNAVVYGLTFESYPRRQASFHIALADQQGKELWRLRVPNPVRGPFPEWQPEPLPQTKTNARVAFTLTGIRWVGTKDYPYLHCDWRVSSSVPEWREGLRANMRFSDPTGNQGPLLPMQEPAWKVRALLHRDRTEDFALSEQLALTNLSMPSPGQFQVLDTVANCGGIQVKAVLIAGPGQLTISNSVARTMKAAPNHRGGHSVTSGSFGRVEQWTSDMPFLLFEATNPGPDDEVQVRAMPEGRPEKRIDTGGWSSVGGVRSYRAELAGVASGEVITLRIILSRPLPYEFLVGPREVSGRRPE